jgi:nucleoside-diphosphate-sugar epimerase
MTHVLVTGATGFLGGQLCAQLESAGWRVTAVLRPDSDASRLPHRIRSRRTDGSTRDLIDVLSRTGPDAVLHLASRFVAEHTHEDVTTLVDGNVRFTVQLLEAMAASGVRSLVNTGTFWQYDTEGRTRPVSLYAATKQAASVLIDHEARARGLRAITLHLFDVYGPGDPRRKLLPLLLDLAAAGGRLDMSPGEQLIDLVHVDDVTRAYQRAAERLLSGQEGDLPAGHERYAVSGGSPVSLRDLVALVGQATGRSLDIAWGARPYREREVMVPWRTGVPLPGWSPRIPLRDGIAECWTARRSPPGSDDEVTPR